MAARSAAFGWSALLESGAKVVGLAVFDSSQRSMAARS